MKRVRLDAPLVNALFRKMVQLEQLAARFGWASNKLQFDGECYEKMYEDSLERLSAKFNVKMERICAVVRLEECRIGDGYESSYRKRINSLGKKLDMKLRDSLDSLVEFEGHVKEARDNLIATSRQISHKTDTALNALDVQVNMTKREIDREVAAVRERFQLAKSKFDEEQIERLSTLDAKFELKRREIEQEIMTQKRRMEEEEVTEDAQGDVQQRAVDNVHLLEERITFLKTQLHEGREAIGSISGSADARMKRMRQAGEKTVKDIAEMLQSIEDAEKPNAWAQLEDELSKRRVTAKAETERKMVELRMKVDNMAVIRDINRDEYKRIINEKRQEMVLSNESELFADLLEEQENEMRRIQDGKRAARDDVEEMRKNLEQKIAEIRREYAEELEATEKSSFGRKQRELERIGHLRSVYEGEMKDVQAGHARESAKARHEADELMEKTTRMIVESTSEWKTLDAELTSLRTMEIEGGGPVCLDEMPVVRLREELDNDFQKDTERRTEQIISWERRCEAEYRKLQRARDDKYASEMAEIRSGINKKTPEYLTTEKEYKAEYERCENDLKAIPEVKRTNNDALLNIDRVIANLTQQCFHLKGTVKFQKAAIESDGQAKVEVEAARFNEVTMEFARKFEKYQRLIDMKTEVADKQREIMEIASSMRGEIKDLEAADRAATLQFERDMKEAMQAETFDRWSELLRLAESDYRDRTGEANAHAKVELNSIKVLIAECKTHVLDELAAMQHAISHADEDVRRFDIHSRNALELRLEAAQQELDFELQANKEVMTKTRCQFEENKASLEQAIVETRKRNKDDDACHFTERNVQLSSNTVALDELSKHNRHEMEKARSERQVRVDFIDECLEVEMQKLNDMKEMFLAKGPRPEERHKLDNLEKGLAQITAAFSAKTKDFMEIKKMMTSREKVYDHRFGKKPVIGTLKGKCIRNARHSYA